MAGERAAIFGRFIELLSESDIDDSNREEVYKVLLDVIEEYDVKGIDQYLDIDNSLEEMWFEKYPPEPDFIDE